MTNPYTPPDSSSPIDESTPGAKRWSRLQWITATVSIVVTVVLSILACVLILQAQRLVTESASLPARLKAGQVSIVRGSWIGGVAAIVGVFLNGLGLFYVRKNILIVAWIFLAVTFIGMISIAVLFKP